MSGNEHLLQRITVLPEASGGKPCIRGSRVTVESVLGRLAQGASPDAILTDHPGLELDDVFACAAYAQTIMTGDSSFGAAVDDAGGTREHRSSVVPGAPSPRISLRELATRPREEIDRAVQAARIVVDLDEIAAWDGTAGDGLDE